MTDNPRKHEPPPEPDAGAARPEPGAGPARPEPVEGRAPEPSLDDQLARAREDAQKYLGNWQRAEADFQNYKKRVDQERAESHRFASAALVMNILPILDDLERALMSVDAHLAGLTWLDGVRLIYRKLQLILENAGVSAIEVEGQQFDPRYHEAVMHAEGEEGKVLAEVQRGYKLHDRVLRPAMVVVGKGKEEPKAEEEGSGSGQGTVDSGQQEEGSGKKEEGEAKDDA